MNRDILRITLPSIISNITVPMLEIVGITIAARCGQSSAVSIGQLAIGISIFNFICWNCNFLRMGTSGMTAQAFGAGDYTETTRMLCRSLTLALTLGALVLIFGEGLSTMSVDIMGGDSLVLEYVKIRMWSIPAEILFFSFHGWYTGMQNATIPMVTSLVVDVVHIVLSIFLALHMELGILGIAYASVVAQWMGVLISILLLVLTFRQKLVRVSLRDVFRLSEMLRFVTINRDFIIRTICINGTYSFFTAASARMGEPVILAVNALLMQIVMLFSYLTDSLAYAAEALVGRYIGAKNPEALRVAISKCLGWSMTAAVLYVILYAMSWQSLLELFIEDGDNLATILAVAERYVAWIFIIPLVGALPFILDGIMVGATQTRVIRNSMIVATLVYFATYYSTRHFLGNNALWLAFTLFIIFRGLMQYVATHRLRSVYSLACASQ